MLNRCLIAVVLFQIMTILPIAAEPNTKDADWDKVVEDSVLKELSTLITPAYSPEQQLAAIERYYPKFPSLGRSAKFLALRTKVGLKVFDRRLSQRYGKEKSLEALERFVHRAPITVELALGAGRLAGRRYNRQVGPLFYVLGLKAKGSEKICTDPDISYDIVRAMHIKPTAPEPKAARAVMNKCWDSVKTTIAANVAKEVGQTSYLLNVCPTLIQHNSLKGLLKKRCQVAIKNMLEKQK
jgi:hypothetical protein